jgi:hypothetical protein
LFPETGKSVVRVLERLGHTVEFRPEQTCCGQMHWNAGYLKEAVPILRHFVQTYRGAETIVVTSSSCVSMMRDHYLKAAESDEYALDRSDGVITGCTVAIAEMGSIVLQNAAAQGARILSLVPNYHLCIVFASQVVQTVPDLLLN